MRRLGTFLFLATYASACVGPISDWPHKSSDSDDPDLNTTPIGTPTQDAGAGAPGGGGSVAGDLGGMGNAPPGGTVAGLGGTTAGGFLAGAAGTTAGAATGGLSGGSSADAGAVVRDAGASVSDASTTTPDLDGSTTGDGGDAGVPDDGGQDAGDGAASDAGCGPLGDAGPSGSCPAYRCTKTLGELSAAAAPMGACNTPLALPLACEGQLGRAAVQCAQDNAFSLSVSRAITSCMRRVPTLTQIPSDCLSCYADETLCTLSRCFVACIDGSDPACQQCRREQCGAALAKCSGLPAP